LRCSKIIFETQVITPQSGVLSRRKNTMSVRAWMNGVLGGIPPRLDCKKHIELRKWRNHVRKGVGLHKWVPRLWPWGSIWIKITSGKRSTQLCSSIKFLKKKQKSRRAKRKRKQARKALKRKSVKRWKVRPLKNKKSSKRKRRVPVKRKKAKQKSKPAKKLIKRKKSKKSSPKKKPKIKKKQVKRKVKEASQKPKRKQIFKQKPVSVKEDEEPKGVLIGEITHYFSKIKVVVLKMTKGNVKVGDQILIKGNSTHFTQRIDSLQIESVDVKTAKKGQLVGLKVKKKAREGDKVLKLK